MNKQQLKLVLDKAKEMCAVSGGRLTEKRRKLLSLLLLAEAPLSAYDLADAYNKTNGASMPAMSVYRILEFLEGEGLVHKISSANKYIACSHICSDHPHQISQFLICSRCQSVTEIAISSSTIEELRRQALAAGYKFNNSQLELQCLCNNC